MTRKPDRTNDWPIYELLGCDPAITVELSGPYISSTDQSSTATISVEATLAGRHHTITTRFHLCASQTKDQESKVTITPAEIEDELDGSAEKLKSMLLQYSPANRLDNHTRIVNLASGELFRQLEALC